MLRCGLCEVDWLNKSDLPEKLSDFFSPFEFFVECGDGRHLISWSPDSGASTECHSDGNNVLVALGGVLPTCQRIVEFMNAGLLSEAERSDGTICAVTRWDGRDLLDYGGDEVPRLSKALSALEDPYHVIVRGSEEKALESVVKDAFLFWLSWCGFDVGSKVEIEVVVSSRASLGGFGKADRITFEDSPWSVPLVGMQLCLGKGATTRAVVCVSDTWLDEVKKYGLMKNGRFFMGLNSEGPVYSHLEPMFENCRDSSLVVGWGKLGESLDVQDMEMLREVALRPINSPPGVLYVCCLHDWSHYGTYFRNEGGVHPVCVLANPKDAQSWVVITNFKEIYLRIDDFSAYSHLADLEVPESFNVSEDDVATLLKILVAEGENPLNYGVPMSTYEVVPDRR